MFTKRFQIYHFFVSLNFNEYKQNFKGCLAVLETLADKGDCQFYNELEAIKKCGTNGYLIGYGGKYCRKFGDNYNSFNEDVG